MQCTHSSSHTCTHADIRTRNEGPATREVRGLLSSLRDVQKDTHSNMRDPLLQLAYAMNTLIFTQVQSVQYLFKWAVQWTCKQHWKTSTPQLTCCILKCHVLHWSAAAVNSWSHHKPPGSPTSLTVRSSADNACCHCVKTNRGLTEDGWVTAAQGSDDKL